MAESTEDVPMENVEEAEDTAKQVEEESEVVEEDEVAKKLMEEVEEELEGGENEQVFGSGEPEADAPEDARAKVDPSLVTFASPDSTMNVMSLADGKLLTSLTDGGARFLLAGARSTFGIKSGRYCFEVRLIELLRASQTSSGQPGPKPLLRLGFSTGGSSLLTNGSESITVDQEGSVRRGESQIAALTCGFRKGDVIAALLNLAEGTPAKNTISFFCNGQRMGPPQPLPQELLGKPLYPTVTFKVVTLQVNCGPLALKPLPFTCPLVAAAAQDDLEAGQGGKAAAGSSAKSQLIFPIGIPNRGYFDLVDQLKAATPGIHEVSESARIEWLAKSGLRGRRRMNDPMDSIDAPCVDHNVGGLDDGSLRSVLLAHLAGSSRDVIYPAAIGNLLREQREAVLKNFPSSSYKRIAVVAMGDPDAEFKSFVQAQALEDKKAKKEIAKRNKQDGRLQFDMRRKQAEIGRRKRDALSKGLEFDEEAVARELGMDVEEDDDAPVTLTEEEVAAVFRTRDPPEASDKAVSKAFTKFSLEQLEGFDEVRCIWSAGTVETASEWLRNWILQKKMSERAEDLEPGEWFKTQMKQFHDQVFTWKRRQSEAKDPTKLKAYLAKKKEEAGGEAAEAKIEIDLDDVDVHGTEDVMDIGDGRPLFVEFAYEDWTLLTTGFELHALLHSFKKDLNDPDRKSFKEADLPFYYQLYHRKSLNYKLFGNEEFSFFLELFKDTVTVEAETSFLLPLQSEALTAEKLLRIVEDNRRERQSTIDAGDETARLTFTRPSGPSGRKGEEKGGKRDKGDWKGDYKGYKGDKGDKGGKKGKSHSGITPTQLGGKGGKGQRRPYEGSNWPSSKKGGGKHGYGQGGYYSSYGYD